MNRGEVRLAIHSCKKCELSKSAHPVPFSGKNPSNVVVLGEAPGRMENDKGEPFVGPAGKMAREWLSTSGLNVDNIAFMNVVSCWPKGTPHPEHIAACKRHYVAQLGLLKPKFVLALGQIATQSILPFSIKMGDIRGRWFKRDGLDMGWCMSTWHPAYILRNPKGKAVGQAYDDVEKFATSVIMGGLAEPKGNEECIRCGKWASVFVQGVGFCDKHKKEVVEVRRMDQMSLLGELE